DVAGRRRALDEVGYERVDSPRAALAEKRDLLLGELFRSEEAGPKGVVDVVVDVSDAVDQADDFSFECPRVLQPGVVEDPVSNLRCEVEATPVALEQFHDSERLLVVAEMPA